MDFEGSRYYVFNRIMLSSIGLWPYQKTWPIRIQRFFCIICIISSIIVQLLTFTTFDYNLDIFLHILSCLIPCFIIFLKYITYCIKIESMQKLIDMIKHDWNMLKSRTEYEIILRYTSVGTFYAHMFALIIYSSVIFVAFVHLIPNFLDLLEPLNQSRPHQLVILCEYFVDSDEYFYPILLHWIVCFFILLSTLLSTTSIHVACIQHICGMFEIASYRIEHALDDYENENLISTKCCIACSGIISAITTHRRAIELVVSLRIIQDLNIIYMFHQT
ncbi:uncharacterized protein LOC114938467 [Nylanderia fulva]|uniref:uncharacterized protein LOC114938467 n=1 Tax=Nylanderia fulva TaxID=613905 RepID=UPI0010FAD1EB|nr:uncharacterized protein LOC114938467 [Nylanderia fulva]